MSHNSGFFPSQNGDREYNADDFRKFIMSFVGDGLTRIDGDESGFEVVAENPASMNVVVGKGSAIIKGSWLNPDSDTTISIPTASSSGNRYDAIVLEFNNTVGTRAVTISVVQGTASANPDYPDMIDTDSIKQLPIAYVYVGIGATSIDDSNIIDNRGTNSCPYASATMDRQELVLPIASNTTLGAIKVGRNLRIEADGTLNATGGGGGGASALSDLEDVDIDWETLTANQALLYDAVAQMWKNQTINTEPPSLVDLPDVNIENLQFGQVLRYNSTNGKWENCNWNEVPLSKLFEKVTIDALSTARYDAMSGNAGDYAIIAGGQGIGADVGTEAYNSELTKSVIDALGEIKYMGASAGVELYALFAGGMSGQTNAAWTTSGAGTMQYGLYYSSLATVYAVDNYLTAITSVSNLSIDRVSPAGAKLNQHAIFAGGHRLYRGTFGIPDNLTYNKVDAYDVHLTLDSSAVLSVARGYIASGIIGDKALFAGGVTVSGGTYYSSGSWVNASCTHQSTVDVVDDSLTVSQAESLSVARSNMASVSTPTHIIFAGGITARTHPFSTQEAPTVSNVVEAYDASLTRMTLTALSSSRQATQNLTGVYKDGWVLFSGANSNLNVDAYDSSFTKFTDTSALGQQLSQARTYLTAMSIGDYIIYAGGYASSAAQTTVDAYKVNIQG